MRSRRLIGAIVTAVVALAGFLAFDGSALASSWTGSDIDSAPSDGPGATGGNHDPGGVVVWTGPRVLGHLILVDQETTLDACSAADLDDILVRYSDHRSAVLALLGVNPYARFLELRSECSGAGAIVAGHVVDGLVLRGNTVVVDGLDVPVCNYTSYELTSSVLGGRYVRFHEWLGHDPALVWHELRVSAHCGSDANVVLLPAGVTLVNRHFLDLDTLGLVGAGDVNVCDFPSWRVFDARFENRFGDRFDVLRTRFGGNPFGVWDRLRLDAACSAPTVVGSSSPVVDDPAPVIKPAPVSGASANPVTPAGTGTVDSAPAGAPNTGDASLHAAAG